MTYALFVLCAFIFALCAFIRCVWLILFNQFILPETSRMNGRYIVQYTPVYIGSFGDTSIITMRDRYSSGMVCVVGSHVALSSQLRGLLPARLDNLACFQQIYFCLFRCPIIPKGIELERKSKPSCITPCPLKAGMVFTTHWYSRVEVLGVVSLDASLWIHGSQKERIPEGSSLWPEMPLLATPGAIRSQLCVRPEVPSLAISLRPEVPLPAISGANAASSVVRPEVPLLANPRWFVRTVTSRRDESL
jgi:hypothetical protein